ncbi:hypothetical protein AKJ66_03735 [candidate division MSBL1 archaeon SCGC-AAA259E22]|uniref:Uncharacterized protein n=1 Tax=candidate division MSBL1 archaeon SCGC-AAA259E22 TaxID=1698265 RepID=A0A133UES0_9EURY|nr:hypothetical protein AKJ66_03735 [candidate division MSBL1 archaeon SCGC-AAA259E22]
MALSLSGGTAAAKTGNYDKEFEIFVDNQLVVHEGHIRNVEPVTRGRTGYSVPFLLTEEGKERFAEKTEGEGGNCGVIYLKRPHDSVLVFKKSFVKELGAGSEGFLDIRYDGGSHRFVFVPASPPDRETGSFNLKVPSVPVKSEGLSANSENYILSLKETGKISRAVFLGEKEEFTGIGSLPSDAVFHSDFLLVEREHDPSVLDEISGGNRLYAVNVKGVTPGNFRENTRTALDEGLFWRNLGRLADADVPFYLTFTNPDRNCLPEFKKEIADRFGEEILEGCFTIEPVQYKSIDENPGAFEKGAEDGR